MFFGDYFLSADNLTVLLNSIGISLRETLHPKNSGKKNHKTLFSE